MQTIGVRELQEQTEAVLRRVREEGETFEVTDQGEVVARLVPAEVTPNPKLPVDQWLARWNQLSEDVSALWTGDTDCVEAIREQRREL